jgi:transcriptional regulator with GAF, ATPase, and Fis domain
MNTSSKRTSVWLHFFGVDETPVREEVVAALAQAQIETEPLNLDQPFGVGLLFFVQVTPQLCKFVQSFSRNGLECLLAIATTKQVLANGNAWRVLQAGASDVFAWPDLPDAASVVKARLERWRAVDDILESPLVRDNLIGHSQIWVAALRQIIEVACFTDSSVLLTGETGTGKELAARLIHTLDTQRAGRDLIVVDCTTIVPELSGSELFGHERGAFTGAISARDGAFAMANGGSLFLDEIGELPLALQVQLLRAVQERTYKRVGSNTWRNTDFRLICATNRDLSEDESHARFRRDLYYRIASWTLRLPPLRERVEDILPLARHFMQQLRPEDEPPDLDEAVQTCLLTRNYPGNVRDLRNLVFRMMRRHVGHGPITIGDIPADDRPASERDASDWHDIAFDQAIRRALAGGAGLKGLRQVVEESAIRIAIGDEGGNLQRAARKLGVTDRALQMRRAEQRQRAQNAAGTDDDIAG